MKKLKWVAAVILLTGCATSLVSTSLLESPEQRFPEPTIVNGDTARLIDGTLSRIAEYGWQFSVVVAQGDDVLLQKAYGRGLTPDTVFNSASVAKPLTAAAIVKLASEDRLQLGDPITRFFAEAPARFQDVTIDHLLAHTSGIRDDYSVEGGFKTAAELRRHVFAQPLSNRPGAKWEYSNFGYGLLALIVEQASGQPFKEYMRMHLFGPAGMRNSGFQGDERWPVAQRPFGTGGLRPEFPRTDTWGFGLGSSDVVTTPADLFRWVTASRRGQVLSETWRRRLDESVIDVGATGLKYGRGWWTRRVSLAGQERLNIWHSGQEETGFSAWLNRYPGEGVVSIFLTHQSFEGYPLREALNSAGSPSVLERLIFGGDVILPPRTVEIGALDRFEGRYRIDPGNWIEVIATPPFLHVVPHGQAAFDALLPARSGERAPQALAAATERTREIMSALQNRDDSVFRRHAGSEGDPPPRELMDGFKSFEVLGSAPITAVRNDGGGLFVTYILVRRNGRQEAWRLRWSGTQPSFFYRSDAPLTPPFRAIDGDSFANFHPFVRGSAVINFDGVGATFGKVSATRQ